jgi:hypothetical protein
MPAAAPTATAKVGETSNQATGNVATPMPRKTAGKTALSRARAAGVPKRLAKPKKLKLKAKTYRLAGTKTTRVTITIQRRLARQILAGLKQRRRATLTLTGAASSADATAPSRALKIRVKR